MARKLTRDEAFGIFPRVSYSHGAVWDLVEVAFSRDELNEKRDEVSPTTYQIGVKHLKRQDPLDGRRVVYGIYVRPLTKSEHERFAKPERR